MSKSVERSAIGLRDEELRVRGITRLFDATIDLFRGSSDWQDTRRVSIKGRPARNVSITVEGKSLSEAHSAELEIEGVDILFRFHRSSGFKVNVDNGWYAPLEHKDLFFLEPVVKAFAAGK